MIYMAINLTSYLLKFWFNNAPSITIYYTKLNMHISLGKNLKAVLVKILK